MGLDGAGLGWDVRRWLAVVVVMVVDSGVIFSFVVYVFGSEVYCGACGVLT